jgi:hypothetical protein
MERTPQAESLFFHRGRFKANAAIPGIRCDVIQIANTNGARDAFRERFAPTPVGKMNACRNLGQEANISSISRFPYLRPS